MNTPTLLRATRSLCLVVGAVLAAALWTAAPVLAQDDVPIVTRTYALENARVVQAPGEVLDRATVIVRNGLIEAVGEDLAVPFDAQRIAADSLIVYAGFISGLSYAGVDEPDADHGDEVDDPGNPPDDRAGIQPDRRARAHLDPDDSEIEALRKIGFTTAHVVPEGRMLPGAGAVVQLAGDSPNAMTLRDDASLFAQFEGGRGVYPATPMAVIAKWRQLYREAERRKTLAARYAENPRGVERPPSDPVHSAFFPVIDGTTPVFFHTDNVLEMHRALALQDELGFPLALAGLHEGFRDPDVLRTTDADLFLSLDLPDEDDWAPPEDTTAADTTEAEPPPEPGDFFLSNFRTHSYEDVEAETENLKARQAIERETYYRNAATLHEAGVRFAFSTLDAKARDIRDHLRTMIEFGLPEDVALAALTTHPAALLDLDAQLGTVEEGKIANLVVTNAPYFAEDSQIRYVFVDGTPFEIDEAAPAAEEGEEAANPVGVWNYTVSTPQGEIGGTLTLSGEPDALEGTITSEMGNEEADLENIELDGARLSFAFDAGDPGRVSVTATIRGDEMEGSLDVPEFGSAPFSATRTSDDPSRWL